MGSSWFMPITGETSTFKSIENLKAYLEIPELSTIVNLKAKAHGNIRLSVLNRETMQPAKNYQNNIKIIRDPNWFQTFSELWRQSSIFREIDGNEYFYLDYPFGFSPLSSKALYTLPGWMMKCHTPDKRPFFMQSDPNIIYEFKWGQDKYVLPKENIIHLNDNRIEIEANNWVTGQSWMTFNAAPINNIREAYQARGFMIENRGAMGILANVGKDVAGVAPLGEDEKRDLREQLAQYGRRRKEVPWIITGLPLEWKQISIDNPANLGLFEEVKEDRITLCHAAGVPPELLPGENGATYENQKWAERRLYENTIIPEDLERIEALNSALDTASRGWIIVGSYEHLNVFQENRKERGDAIARLMNGLKIALDSGAISAIEIQQELAKFGIVAPTK